MRSFVPTFLVFLILLPSIGCRGEKTKNAETTTAKRLNGGGSSFVYPLMSKWVGIYEKEKNVQVNYQSVGSGAGIHKMTAKEFDFGCTDAPMNQEQMEKAKKAGGEVIHIPLVMGAVVPAYNLEEVTETLQFTGPLLADIFLRKITKWNDERIKAINPNVASQLPAKNINVVRRADGSGTTYIFSDYLSKVSPEWKESVGVDTSLHWPGDTIGAKGSEGMAGQIKLNPGAIGYIEVTYVLQNKISFGSVQNQAGEFILGSLDSVVIAANNCLTQIPDDMRFSLTNAPGKGPYPICGTVWAVLYTNQTGENGQQVVDFLRWATREDKGQKYTRDLHYAPLPKGVIDRIDAKLAQIKTGG
jgi:phosphate transport system substrate-binding protein